MSRSPVDIELLKRRSNPIREIAEHYRLDAGHVYLVADTFLPSIDNRRSPAHDTAFKVMAQKLGGENGAGFRHFVDAISTIVQFHRA